MRGYDNSSYGAGFADVYDEWYADVTNVEATVGRVISLAGTGADVLELGVGTGRLAIPMADAGLAVTGVDSSPAMLDRLAALDPDGRVAVVLGDMVDDAPPGEYDLVLVAYNTIFNLLDEAAQSACFVAAATRLRPGGCFVVEAFVPHTGPGPDAGPGPAAEVTVRSMTVDRVVLAVSRHDPDAQSASGQFIDITETGGVRLRPWRVRWSTPAQLDAMAAAAGLHLDARWSDMSGTPFDEDSSHHVSVYRATRPDPLRDDPCAMSERDGYVRFAHRTG